MLGSLCGFRNVSQIHHWAENARVKEFLKEKFQITHIPCYFWLLTLLKMVKPDTLNECMMKWASQFMPENRNGTTISLDGKTIRSTVGREIMDSPLRLCSKNSVNATSVTKSEISRFRSRRPLPPDPYCSAPTQPPPLAAAWPWQVIGKNAKLNRRRDTFVSEISEFRHRRRD